MKKRTTAAAVIGLLGILAAVILTILLFLKGLNSCFPGIWEALISGDTKGMQACVTGQRKSYAAGLMWLLTFVQVLSVVIPAMPVQLAAGAALGTGLGFAVCYSGAIAANITAYWIARRISGLLCRVAEERPKIGSMLNSLSINENRTYYTVMALLVPGLPNGVIPYAAVNSGVKFHMFVAALIIALPLPGYLTCAAGFLSVSRGLSYGMYVLGLLYGIVWILYGKRKKLPALLRNMLKK